jgi:hypothetical protein
VENVEIFWIVSRIPVRTESSDAKIAALREGVNIVANGRSDGIERIEKRPFIVKRNINME